MPLQIFCMTWMMHMSTYFTAQFSNRQKGRHSMDFLMTLFGPKYFKLVEVCSSRVRTQSNLINLNSSTWSASVRLGCKSLCHRYNPSLETPHQGSWGLPKHCCACYPTFYRCCFSKLRNTIRTLLLLVKNNCAVQIKSTLMWNTTKYGCLLSSTKDIKLHKIQDKCLFS